MTQSFGPYEILEKVGEGAYAQIFQARKGGEELALKRLKPHLIYDSERTSVFQTEAKLLELVAGERHFPKLFDHGKIEDEYYLALEFIKGFTLREIVNRTGGGTLDVPIQQRVQIIWDLLRGIEYLHGLESKDPVIHGDLKPSNVMLSQKGEVKILDLGLKGGTFDYIPIERLHDKIIGPYSDIYATGQILYELLYGKRLLSARNELEAYFEMRDLVISKNLFEGSLPDEIKDILVKSLRQDLPSRYASASEFRQDLEKFLGKGKEPYEPQPYGAWLQEIIQ